MSAKSKTPTRSTGVVEPILSDLTVIQHQTISYLYMLLGRIEEDKEGGVRSSLVTEHLTRALHSLGENPEHPSVRSVRDGKVYLHIKL